MSNIVAIPSVNLSEAQQKAIRKMSLQTKDSAKELADNLVAQVIRGRFKAMFASDATKKKLGERYDSAAQLMGGVDKMPLTREKFIEQQLAEVKELLAELND